MAQYGARLELTKKPSWVHLGHLEKGFTQYTHPFPRREVDVPHLKGAHGPWSGARSFLTPLAARLPDFLG